MRTGDRRYIAVEGGGTRGRSAKAGHFRWYARELAEELVRAGGVKLPLLAVELRHERPFNVLVESEASAAGSRVAASASCNGQEPP